MKFFRKQELQPFKLGLPCSRIFTAVSKEEDPAPNERSPHLLEGLFILLREGPGPGVLVGTVDAVEKREVHRAGMGSEQVKEHDFIAGERLECGGEARLGEQQVFEELGRPRRLDGKPTVPADRLKVRSGKLFPAHLGYDCRSIHVLSAPPTGGSGKRVQVTQGPFSRAFV